MAAVAVAAKVATVNVIALMTAVAVVRQANFTADGRASMTEVAIQFVMYAFQFVVGVFSVVEDPCLPIIGVVALSTIIAEATFVFFVVLLMAIVAFAGGILILVREVTLFARGDGVLTNEWELAEIVVKKEVVAPTFFVMTLLTLFTLLAAMHILSFVAGITLCF